MIAFICDKERYIADNSHLFINEKCEELANDGMIDNVQVGRCERF